MIRTKVTLMRMAVLNATRIDAIFVIIFLCNPPNRFSSYRTGKSYYIRSRLTCHSRNVIYLASCKKCQLQYIGSTTKKKVRFRNHKSSMLTNKKSCEVAVHFTSAPHCLQDFEFQCIDQIVHANSCAQLENLLITKEAYWSAQLFTFLPYGLNKRQEFN